MADPTAWEYDVVDLSEEVRSTGGNVTVTWKDLASVKDTLKRTRSANTVGEGLTAIAIAGSANRRSTLVTFDPRATLGAEGAGSRPR